jgi:hypothetical protein
MTARRRCPRGHFAPATGTCPCTRRSYIGQHTDLYGQGLHPGTRVTTVRITGSYL